MPILVDPLGPIDDLWDAIKSGGMRGGRYLAERLGRNAVALAQGNGYGGRGMVDGVPQGDRTVEASQESIRNAFAHVRTSAEITFRLGRERATGLGNIKERMPGAAAVAHDQSRDQYHNELGRRIADYAREHNLSQAELDHLTVDAFNNGHFITQIDPSKPGFDPRIAAGADPTWTGPSAEWRNASRGRDYEGTATGHPLDVAAYTFGITSHLAAYTELRENISETVRETAVNLSRSFGQAASQGREWVAGLFRDDDEPDPNRLRSQLAQLPLEATEGLSPELRALHIYSRMPCRADNDPFQDAYAALRESDSLQHVERDMPRVTALIEQQERVQIRQAEAEAPQAGQNTRSLQVPGV